MSVSGLEEGARATADSHGGRYRGARGRRPRPQLRSSPTSTSCSSPSVRRLRAQRTAGTRAASRSQIVVTGVSRGRRAVRARARGGRRPRARPPRPLLGRAAARARPAVQAPPAAAVRRRHRARRLPPAARRPPEIGNNALLAAALGARAHRAVRRHDGRARSASRALRRATASRRAELVARVREAVAAASRSPSPTAPSRVRTIGIVSGAGADHLERRDRRGPRRLRHRRAGRARRWRAPARPASTSSPPATTRRRPSACARWASCLAERFGVRHVFVDVPNPI